MKKIISLFSPIVIFVLLFTAFLSTEGASGSASNATIGVTDQRGTEQVGPPWFNASWYYRRPVTVTNSGAALPYYQVLVTLTSSNFDFSLAKTDGSDIRFTAADGTTELKYWIESWSSASQLAYVWVRVPSLVSGNTTIYLYYGNSGAATTSDGTGTFDFFDDRWCQFAGSGCNIGNPVLYATQSWWEGTTTYPMVFEDTSAPDGYRYHMLYDGHNIIGHAKGYAYSNDLNTWTHYDGGDPHPPNPNPIMGTGYAGNYTFAWGDTMKVGSTYYMFVSRGPGTGYRVQSTDLVTWTNFTALTVVNDAGGIGSGMAVLKQGDGITPIVVDNKYWMVYYHGDTPGSMYLASSPFGGDLGTWTSTGSAIIAPTAGSWDALGMWTPSLIRFGDTYYVYYQGNGPGGWETGFAKADATSGGNPIPPPSNPASWTKSDTDSDGDPDPVLHRGPSAWDSGEVIDPMVRQFSNGTYYLFYTGNVANGYAYSTSPEGPWTKYDLAGPWTTVGGSPSTSAGILTLNAGAGIKTSTSFQYQAVGYRANFGLGGGMEWGGFIDGSSGSRTMIGDLNTDPSNMYLKNYVGSFVYTLLPRVGGVDWHGDYHVYEVRWRSGQSTGDIDHGASSASSSSQVPSSALPVTLYSYTSANATLLVDWVYVRQYRSPQPTMQVGAQQSAVNLGVTKTDFPDPLYAGDALTYLLTVSNSSAISAPGVIVTDTLPANVQLTSVVPSQGSCTLGSKVVCNLSTIPASSTAIITIVVNTMIEGVITNTSVVDSPSYDLDLNNNTSQVETVVLPLADLSVSKQDSPDPVYIADPLVYTVTVANNGPSLASSVMLTDTLPVQMSFQYAHPAQGSCVQASPVVCNLGSISSSASVRVVIGVIPGASGGFTNSVDVVSDAYDRNLANNHYTLLTTVLPMANLGLTLTDQPDPVVAGEYLTYTLNVNNAGPSSASGVTLVDNLPANVSFFSVNPPSCSHGGSTVSCNLGSLGSGGNTQVTIVVQVSPSATGTLVDNANVSSSTYDPDMSNNSRITNTQVSTVADLSVSKVDDPDPVWAGETLEYTITVHNAGPSVATGVVLTDTLPAEMALLSAVPGQGSCDLTSPVTCDLDSISVGGSVGVIILVNPTIDGVFTNTVNVASNNIDRNEDNNTASAVTTVTPSADVGLTITYQPDPVYAGDLLTYTLVISNVGPSQAEGALLTDTLPVGVDFVSAPACTQAGGVVSCNLGNLVAGNIRLVIITVRVQSAWLAPIQNNAEVHAVTYDPDVGNNHDVENTAVNTKANLGLTLTGQPDPVVAGEYLTYTLNVNNAGPSVARGVMLVDSLPVNVTFVSVVPSWCTHVGSAVSCNLGDLGSDGNTQVTIVVRVSPYATGTLCDYANVSSSTYDPDMSNNSPYICTPVSTVADMSVIKVDDPDPVRAEEPLVYTVTVSNAGPSVATGVMLTDTLPAEMDLQSAVPGQGSCDQTSPVTCDLGSIVVSGSVDVIIQVIPTIDGVFTNTANVASNNIDPDEDNNTYSEVTTVTPVANVSLTIADQPDPVYAGDLLTYTLAVSNAGPSLAEGVLLIDTLPDEVDFVSAPGCTQADGMVTCNLGDLAAGNTELVVLTVRVQSSQPRFTSIQNCAEVHAMTYDPAVGNNHDCEGTIVDTSADLMIDITDNPDPLLPDQDLTYTLWITNNGPSDALDVSVVNTLPSGITFMGTDPDICYAVFPTVTCTLGTISGTVTTQIMIFTNVGDVVGRIHDYAEVTSGSPTDPDPTNNSAEEETLVDILSPEVHWVEPVDDGELKFVIGQPITLTVEATDNDQVAYVFFYWWDHINNVSHPIGTVYSAPYTLIFDSSTLPPNVVYSVIAIAYDRVGHWTQEFIRMKRVEFYSTFIPIVAK